MLKKILRIVLFVALFLLLTVLTQTGGILLLILLPIFRWLQRKVHGRALRIALYPLVFLVAQFICAFLIIPPIAEMAGREPLPISESDVLQPASLLTPLMNRHYVVPELKSLIMVQSDRMAKDHPGSIVLYLDANFPFWDGFPLIPHLSHSDGQKLDLAFFYQDRQTGEQLNAVTPSPIGYGVYESPRENEPDYVTRCSVYNAWQYGILEKIVPQGGKEKLVLDEPRTAHLLNLITDQPNIGKVFIEPHLKLRMGLQSEKIRFQGCHSIRHDDHIHLQLKN